MTSIPLIRASQLQPFTVFLRRLGAPVDTLMRQAKLPLRALHDANALIPEYAVWAFVGEASASQGMDDFGLRVAEASAVEDVGAFGDLLMNSPTLHVALERICRMIAVHSTEARFWLSGEGDEVRFCREGIRKISVGRDPVEQYTLMFMVNLVRQAAGARWQPARMWLQSGRAMAPVHDPLFEGAEVHFQQPVTAIALPHALLNLPLRPALRTGRNRVVTQTFMETAPPDNFTGSLQAAITGYLKERYPDVELAAEFSGVSVRTLQRRLSEAGVSYSELVDQTRYEKAVCLLDDPTLTFTDIAYELAYTDPAHFTRACRRWTGLTPREYRRRRRKMGSEST